MSAQQSRTVLIMVRLAGLVAALVALSSMAAAEDDTGQFGQQHNESLFWGPYKPNLYFGLRSRAPHGLWMGMAWAKMEQFSDLQTGESLFVSQAPLGC